MPPGECSYNSMLGSEKFRERKVPVANFPDNFSFQELRFFYVERSLLGAKVHDSEKPCNKYLQLRSLKVLLFVNELT